MDLERVLHNLMRPAALAELAALLLCLALAWIVARVLCGTPGSRDSIWFGDRLVDGVLFPLLALGFALAARTLFAQWITPAVFRLAVPILLSLVVIRLSVRVLGATFPQSRALHAAGQSISWLAWGVVVLHFTGVLAPLLDAMGDLRWKMGAHQVSLLDVLEVVLTTAAVLVAALWISAAIERRLLRDADNADLSVRKIAANLLRALLLFIGLMLGLTAVGVDLTTLSVLSGALGVGIGFGFQKIASNYVSGFVILGERSLRIGDQVKVDNFEGRITDIRTRYTMVRAGNGREAIVPNEMLITQRVENLSRVTAESRLSVDLDLRIPHDTDAAALLPALEAALRGVDRVLAEPPPSAQLTGFGPEGLKLNIAFSVADPGSDPGRVRSDAIVAVLGVLQQWRVEVPAAQRVVHDVRPSPLPRGPRPLSET